MSDYKLISKVVREKEPQFTLSAEKLKEEVEMWRESAIRLETDLSHQKKLVRVLAEMLREGFVMSFCPIEMYIELAEKKIKTRGGEGKG